MINELLLTVKENTLILLTAYAVVNSLYFIVYMSFKRVKSNFFSTQSGVLSTSAFSFVSINKSKVKKGFFLFSFISKLITLLLFLSIVLDIIEIMA
jgi:hypothetical protein